jgi:hypothetical protein
LLHYTAANGVEIRRQVVPHSADQIAALLLSAGADVAATLNAYGGSYDTSRCSSRAVTPPEPGRLQHGSNACSQGTDSDQRHRHSSAQPRRERDTFARAGFACVLRELLDDVV